MLFLAIGQRRVGGASSLRTGSPMSALSANMPVLCIISGIRGYFAILKARSATLVRALSRTGAKVFCAEIAFSAKITTVKAF
jgi:hypothetical protein